MKKPTYPEEVKGGTGHKEVVEIEFDPLEVIINPLLFIIFHFVYVTDGFGRFCNLGQSFTTAIFTTNQTQEHAAKEAIKR